MLVAQIKFSIFYACSIDHQIRRCCRLDVVSSCLDPKSLFLIELFYERLLCGKFGPPWWIKPTTLSVLCVNVTPMELLSLTWGLHIFIIWLIHKRVREQSWSSHVSKSLQGWIATWLGHESMCGEKFRPPQGFKLRTFCIFSH